MKCRSFLFGAFITKSCSYCHPRLLVSFIIIFAMAGYSLVTPTANPNSHKKRNSLFLSSRRSSINSPNELSMNHNHRFGKSRGSSSKVIKSKSKTMQKSTIKSGEREKYLTKYFEPTFSNQNGIKSQASHIRSFYNRPIFNCQNPVLQSTPISSLNNQKPQIHSEVRDHRFSLLNEIKNRGLTAICSSQISNQHISNVFQSFDDYKLNVTKNQKSYEVESKLNRVQSWKLPQNSNTLKSSIDPKINIIYSSEIESIVQRNVESIQEAPIGDKLKSVNLFRSDRQSVCSTLKSFFTKSWPFNKFREFIPFKTWDYEVSEKAQVELPEEDILPTWTEDMENEICDILTSKSRLLVKAFSININTTDIATLYGNRWLNDAVIEFYFNLITERAKNNPKYPSVYTFGTFFYTRLSKGQPLGRWAKKLDFFSYEFLIMPINAAAHWRLVIVDNFNKRVEYYDSLGGEFRSCVDLIVKFLMTESVEKRKEPLDLSEWTILHKVPSIPLQNNSYDCGVFTCKYAEYIARRAPITFVQDDIQLFRKCMMYEIIHQKLLVT